MSGINLKFQSKHINKQEMQGDNMTNTKIYQDIATRTGGDIYIGVVGPVRTGKSTFIKRFMDVMVIPNIKDGAHRERAVDELPQSASGRTIMTTEPKFIPEDAVDIDIDDNCHMSVRMIDCVGYIVPGSIGYIEDEQPRMVKTPWFEEEVPFNMAAEYGTHKVIDEHSTIGVVITTDGSIGEISRDDYVDAEDRVIRELKEINKPFIVLLNSVDPHSVKTEQIAQALSEKHSANVIPVDCSTLNEESFNEILSAVLQEFPIKEAVVTFPTWTGGLKPTHWLKKKMTDSVYALSKGLDKISSIKDFINGLKEMSEVTDVINYDLNMGTGEAKLKIKLDEKLMYSVLSETTGIDITDEEQLLSTLFSLAQQSREYKRVKDALDEVEATGYGIVMPQLDELTLEEPEIIKQGGRYGVRLRASAPSIHMMKADITTEVQPIVGSEKQSEDLIMYLLNEFEENPIKIWDSNIFGKSLHELVNEGLHTKLSRMPPDARMRLQETLERVINEGCSGLICIIL